MTGIERPTTIDGDEMDVFNRASRRALKFKAGQVAAIKRKARRRDRHNRKHAIRVGRADHL